MNIDTKFDGLLKEYQPDLYIKLKSEQNELSKEILRLRLENDMDVETIASLLDFKVENYLLYEFGSLDFTVDQYNLFITRMSIMLNKKITLTSHFNVDIPNYFSDFVYENISSYIRSVNEITELAFSVFFKINPKKNKIITKSRNSSKVQTYKYISSAREDRPEQYRSRFDIGNDSYNNEKTQKISTGVLNYV